MVTRYDIKPNHLFKVFAKWAISHRRGALHGKCHHVLHVVGP